MKRNQNRIRGHPGVFCRWLAVILALMLVFPSLPAFAGTHGTGGSSMSVGHAQDGFGWYNFAQDTTAYTFQLYLLNIIGQNGYEYVSDKKTGLTRVGREKNTISRTDHALIKMTDYGDNVTYRFNVDSRIPSFDAKNSGGLTGQNLLNYFWNTFSLST